MIGFGLGVLVRKKKKSKKPKNGVVLGFKRWVLEIQEPGHNWFNRAG